MEIDLNAIAGDVVADLVQTASSSPNERLPKEEQIRSRIYMNIRPLFSTVCLERAYLPIEVDGTKECDIWARDKNGQELWIEIKRSWSIRSWNNKPNEQLRDWQTDIHKLSLAPLSSTRIFFLVGFTDCKIDLAPKAQNVDRLLALIAKLHAPARVYENAYPFSWRSESINQIGIWIWLWKPGLEIVKDGSV